jgi:hypothetical protein
VCPEIMQILHLLTTFMGLCVFLYIYRERQTERETERKREWVDAAYKEQKVAKYGK